MCGLIAALGPRSSEHVQRGVLEMRHRGYRATTRDYSFGSIGHVRLPIVGTSVEHDQPITIGSSDDVLTFVGEVLDFRDERPDLECDVDFVKERWYLRGVKALIDRDGFWSVAVLRRNDHSIMAFTDYLAQKPLYYRFDTLVAAVASEPHALAKLAPTTPDEIYLSACIKWGYCPETWRTPHVEIRKLPPGHALSMNLRAGVQTMLVDELRGRESSITELRVAVEDAVRRRVMSSDVHVSALVSGGLDSAITYKLARRDRDLDFVFHVDNGAEDRAAFDLLTRADPHAYVVELNDVMPSEALAYMQEPIDLGSLRPQIALARAIGDKTDVCLTGDGADELFGGYERSDRYDSQSSDVWHELVAWHLPRLDRVMMRHCVEQRSPFLAREVAEIALGFPHELRKNKIGLRQAFKSDLPHEIVFGKKRALRTPIVAKCRESVSKQLVDVMREIYWS